MTILTYILGGVFITFGIYLATYTVWVGAVIILIGALLIDHAHQKRRLRDIARWYP